MNKATLGLSSVILVAVALAVMTTHKGEAQAEEQALEVRPQTVKVISVQSSLPEATRRFPGRVAASETADVSAKVGGLIQEVHVSAGDQVAAGDLLLELDATDYQLNLAQTQANYDLAKVSFDRVATSRERNIATQADYDQAKANFDKAKVALQQAKNQLSDTKVRAPFNGRIVRLDAKKFDFIGTGQSLINMQSTENIDIDFQVPSDIVASISGRNVQSPVDVIFDAFPQQTYEAKLKEFTADSDRSTNSFNITLTMKAPKIPGNLLSGMNASVLLNMRSMGQKNLLSIPSNAVTRQADQSIVWRVIDNKVKATPVTLGELTADQIIVQDGLSEGDVIVAAGVHKLVDGQAVAVWFGE